MGNNGMGKISRDDGVIHIMFFSMFFRLFEPESFG